MKQASINLTSSDIEVILCTLSIYSVMDLADTDAQNQINSAQCSFAAEKLMNRDTNLTSNEWRVIFVSLKAAEMIAIGELSLDDEALKDCNRYLFTINKLASALEKHFDKLLL